MALKNGCTGRQEQQLRQVMATKRLATAEEREVLGFIGRRTYVVADATGYMLLVDTDNGAVG